MNVISRGAFTFITLICSVRIDFRKPSVGEMDCKILHCSRPCLVHMEEASMRVNIRSQHSLRSQCPGPSNYSFNIYMYTLSQIGDSFFLLHTFTHFHFLSLAPSRSPSGFLGKCRLHVKQIGQVGATTQPMWIQTRKWAAVAQQHSCHTLHRHPVCQAC